MTTKSPKSFILMSDVDDRLLGIKVLHVTNSHFPECGELQNVSPSLQVVDIQYSEGTREVKHAKRFETVVNGYKFDVRAQSW